VKIAPFGDSLLYSTYIGGATGDERAYAGRINSSGELILVGQTSSTDFPTASAFQASNGGGEDGFLVRLSASGSTLVNGSYLGGSGDDITNDIALDPSGNIYLAGKTASANFPLSGSTLDNTLDGVTDAFVTKFAADAQSLVYSTYLGGTAGDAALALDANASGEAFLTGYSLSADFPKVLAYDSTYGGGATAGDVFVSRLNASGTGLIYSTYVGGTSDEAGLAIQLDSANNAFVHRLHEVQHLPHGSGARPRIQRQPRRLRL